MNKKYLLLLILPVLALASMGVVYADTTVGQGAGPMSSLVSAIAEKFNLNVSDVQQVFDEQRSLMQEQMQQRAEEMQSDMQAKFEERLAEAVSAGDLTQAQADQIIAKRAELQAERDDLQTANRENMQEHMQELQQWAEENNIPLEYLHFGPGGGMRMGHGMMGPDF